MMQVYIVCFNDLGPRITDHSGVFVDEKKAKEYAAYLTSKETDHSSYYFVKEMEVVV